MRVVINVNGRRATLDAQGRDPDGKFGSGSGGGSGGKKEESKSSSASSLSGSMKGGEYHPSAAEAKVFGLGNHGMHATGSGKRLSDKEHAQHVANMKAANELRQRISEKHGDVRINKEKLQAAHEKVVRAAIAKEQKSRGGW